jgi:hypothetical protein
MFIIDLKVHGEHFEKICLPDGTLRLKKKKTKIKGPDITVIIQAV